MRVLDRYLLREMVSPLCSGLIAFTSLFVGADLVSIVQSVLDYGAPLGVAGRLFLLKLPQIFVWTFPMAVLLAVLLSLGRLSANSEIVAMQAGGVSLRRIAAVAVVVGLLVSFITLAITEWAVPVANQEYNRVMVEQVRGGRLPAVSSNVVLTDYERGKLRGLVYAARFDHTRAEMSDVTIVAMEQGRPVETTFAQKVVWGGSAWYMTDGIIHRHGNSADAEVTTLVFRDSRQPVPINYGPRDIIRSQKRPEEMTMRELADYIAIMEERGQDTRRHQVQFHLKLAIPAASLVFALVGAPLGIHSHRSAASVGFGISVVVIFVYYVIMTLSTALGQGGQLPPVVAAWLQNLIVGGVGIGLMMRPGWR